MVEMSEFFAGKEVLEVFKVMIRVVVDPTLSAILSRFLLGSESNLIGVPIFD